MATGVRDKYNIAINSKGYILRGAPGKVAYSRSVLPSQVNRMAISDLVYSDFAGQGLFYLAQADWSAGFKDEKRWRDDAKFYYSTNIDAYSNQGRIQLEKELSLHNDFDEDIIDGCYGEVNGVTDEYVGCDDDASGYCKIYKYHSSTWTDIAGTDFSTNQNVVSQVLTHKEDLYAITIGTGTSDVVASYNGSSWTDHTSDIQTASSITSVRRSIAMCEYANKLWVCIDDYLNDEYAIMSTDDGGSTWTEELHTNNTGGLPVAIMGFNSLIYYLVEVSYLLELRVFDPSDSSDTLVYTFEDATAPGWGGHKLLVRFKNKLIITIPNTKIYELTSGGDLNEIWNRDDDKYSEDNHLATGYILYGAVEYDDRLYWGNLVYDGTAFYNHKQPYQDTDDQRLLPLYINELGDIRYRDNDDKSKLYENSSNYKSTIANNYLIMNEMAPVEAIDKFLDSVTILFESMSSNESIKVYYSIDERNTWTEVGTHSYSAADDSTKKTWSVPNSVLFNKIWFKVHLDGTSTTSVLTDLVMAYRPMPDYKNRWDLRLNFSETVNLLNTQQEQMKGSELNAELWNEKNSKQTVVFEDIDYVECDLVSAMTSAATSATVNNTSHFSRQGRIRAVSGDVVEEMTYTSATSNKLLGVSRAQRGTVARAYAIGQQLDSGYDVYVEDIQSEVSFTDKKKTEYVAQVLLIEK